MPASSGLEIPLGWYYTKYDHEFNVEDKRNSLINQKHGALDLYQKLYHLLTTKIFDNAINERLFKLFKRMNYILKYG